MHLAAPIVAMAATPDGLGYWLAAADGGVFAFGDARWLGSTGRLPLVSHVVGMAATPDGGGYWLVAADGGVFAFGDAGWFGSMGERPLDAPVVGMATTPDGGGYWLAGADGGIYAFGDAPWLGSAGGSVPVARVSTIAATPDGGGYWLLEPDQFRYALTDPSPATAPHGGAVVRAALSQLGINPRSVTANRPHHYQPWNAAFACWAWQRAGIRIPSYPQSRSVFLWANQHERVLRRSALPAPGDIVLFGAGAASPRTSVAAGVVAQVWPDGSVLAVEGDAGPGAPGHRGVVLVGPFRPSLSAELNGAPVYGYTQPR